MNNILNKAEKIIDEDSIIKKLKSNEKVIIKFGADPSRPDLHLGHTVALRVLKNMQDLGAEIVFIIGDFTAMIGDPTGKSKTRPALTFDETRKNGQTYLKQVSKILDMSKTKVVYNSEWYSKMNFQDVINLTSKYTVARILERDDFAKRFKNKTPIGIHEFLYPLMQGYDSVKIHSSIEVGGTDQIFNLLVGRELQKDYGQEPQDIMVFPLLVGLDGKEKMSKSLGNYIGLSEAPEVMFEKCMRVPDNILFDYFRLTTDLNLDDVKRKMDQDIFEAHKVYAREIVKMYHGKEFIKDAEERYNTISHGGIPNDIKTFTFDKDIKLIDLLFESNLVSSKSEAKRLIEQNGIKINNRKENDINKVITKNDFINNELIIQKGKKEFLKVIIK